MHIVVVIVIIFVAIAACDACSDRHEREEKARVEEAQRQRRAELEAYQRREAERQRQQEQVRKQQALRKTKQVALQEFAQKEMPRAWATYQEIGVLINERTSKIKELESTLELLRPGSSSTDQDLLALKRKVDEIKNLKNEIYKSIEDAYISAAKFAAEFGSEEEQRFKDSMNSAKRNTESVISRFEEMRKIK